MNNLQKHIKEKKFKYWILNLIMLQYWLFCDHFDDLENLV